MQDGETARCKRALMDTGSTKICGEQDGLVRKESLMREMRRVWLRLRILLMILTGRSIRMSLRGM